MVWHYREAGAGRPLILLHGIGMSHAAWHPVFPLLSATRRVIAFDVAGFGESKPLPRGTPPTLSNLVDSLVRSMRELDLSVPVDLVGNSLGGALALEAARRGIARSVVAISPAGLWRDHPSAHVGWVFSGMRFLATRLPLMMKATARVAPLRAIAFTVPLSPESWRMPVNDARRAFDDLAAATAFEATFEHTRTPFRGSTITAPVTIAFGDRDWILREGSRRRDAVPAHTRWVVGHGWGHVPMWVDPVGVSRLILDGTQ